jgi:hypothetical protein
MADRIFLRLNDRLALGADDLQWILYSSIRKAPPLFDAPLVPGEWRTIASVSSTRDILARCVRESGFGEHTAASAVESLPSTFAAWKAAKASPEHELEHS